MTSCELHDLCQFVFQNFELHHQEVMGLFLNEIMCAINTGVAGISVKMLSMFSSIVREYKELHYVVQIPLHFINRLSPQYATMLTTFEEALQCHAPSKPGSSQWAL